MHLRGNSLNRGGDYLKFDVLPVVISVLGEICVTQ